MNVKLLNRVKAHIKRYPEKFDMDSYCGTAQCIGGLVGYLATGKAAYGCVNVAKVLQVDEEKSMRLCHYTRWPDHLFKQYAEAKNATAAAQAACDRIDHFIETKGEE